MVLGVLIGRKKYPLLKYLFILMIVAGVAMFMYKDSGKKGQGTYLIKTVKILLYQKTLPNHINVDQM